MFISLQSYHHDVWAIQKECIPKEGMPHAHKACQKREREREREKMHTQRRCASKKGEKNIAHTKNITRETEII